MSKETVEGIYDAIRSKFIWVSDEDLHGTLEVWGRPKEDEDGFLREDCDGFSLECYYRLRSEGVDATIAAVNAFGLSDLNHLVCLVPYNGGWFVLDCRQRRVRDIDEMKLEYTKWYIPDRDRSIADPWVRLEVA